MKRKPTHAADTKLQEVLNRLKGRRWPALCVDVETSGLHFMRNAIVGYVVTFGPNRPDSFYVPFRHAGTANVGQRPGLTGVESWDRKLGPGEKELLRALDGQPLLFGHHFAFDLRFMLATGEFTCKPRCEDSSINEPILDEHVGRYSLESCAHRYKVESKKSAEITEYLCSLFPEARKDPKKAMGHYWRLFGDDEIAVDYAEQDGTTTWQLRDKQLVQILKQEEWRGQPLPTLEQIWDVESRLVPVLARMSHVGIKIDEAALSGLKKHIKSNTERLANTFPSGFNPKSPNDVRHWMERHNCTDWPNTAPSIKFPRGQPSFPEGWLMQHEPGQLIVQWRKFETLRSTFVLPLEVNHVYKGRVHASFNQLRGDQYGTVTGRLSTSDPNVGAVPKHDDETQAVPMGPLYRKLFIPDDGQKLGTADYEQIEPRLLAYYTGCRVLIKGYLSDPPLDAHTTAAMYANRNWSKLTKAEQKHYRNAYAKRINQTIITGGGKKVIVEKYKVPADEVDEAWAAWHKAMPEVRPAQKAMERRYRERGFVLTLLNRRCRLDDPQRAYTAMNRLLQGGNADCIKIKMIEIDEYLKSVGRPVDMLNSIHDDLMFQFPEEQRKHYDECLRIMQAFGPNDTICLRQKLDGQDVMIPLPVDPGEGANWAEATYGTKK